MSKEVLIVDDEVMNLDLLQETLTDAGYRTTAATNGKQALALLQQNPEKFSVVVLDKILPEMQGMQLLLEIKNDDRFNGLPVILKTTSVAEDDLLEGLNAGAYYYLTKPYEKDILLSIVSTAVKDWNNYQQLKQQLKQSAVTMDLLRHATFRVRNLDETRILSSLLAKACPNPEAAVMGFSELIINGIEHGNLGIDYETKSILLKNNCWLDEVNERLNLPGFRDRFVTVSYLRTDDEIQVIIEDCGDGFDWRPYQQIDPERALHGHGRGIAMANMLSFDRLEYMGNGNTVICYIYLGENKPNRLCH